MACHVSAGPVGGASAREGASPIAVERSLMDGTDEHLVSERLTALCFVSILRQIVQEVKEPLVLLADEKAVISEGLDRTQGSPLCLRRPNNRTDWELSVQKRGWLGHDQIGLQGLRLVCFEVL